MGILTPTFFRPLLLALSLMGLCAWAYGDVDDDAAAGSAPQGEATAPAHSSANEGGNANPFQVLVPPPTDAALSLEERFDRSDWVALVHIESIGNLINTSLSQAPDMVAVQAFNYRASVLRNWKGEQKDSVKFRVDLSDCRTRLDVDGEYVVFGFINSHGKPQSFGCADLMPRELTNDLLAQVEAISAARSLAQNP